MPERFLFRLAELNLRRGGSVGLGGGGRIVRRDGDAVEQGTAPLDACAEDAHVVRARRAVAGVSFLERRGAERGGGTGCSWSGTTLPRRARRPVRSQVRPAGFTARRQRRAGRRRADCPEGRGRGRAGDCAFGRVRRGCSCRPGAPRGCGSELP